MVGNAKVSGSLYFYDTGDERIASNGTMLTIQSGEDINLTCAGGDVNIPADIGLTFGDDGEKIEGDGTDLTIESSNVLTLQHSSTLYLKKTNNWAAFSSANSTMILYENAGASTDDYMMLSCTSNGATKIQTVDASSDNATFILDIDGAITLDSHNGEFILKNANTEFSPANSAYAGMILGYTRIQNNGTGSTDNILTINSSAMTVLQTNQGTDFSIQFIVPPSGNVEIQCSFWMSGSSKGAKFSLSTDPSYAELGISHTYDADQTVYIDETDHDITNISFAVTGLTAGTDTTYYLAGLASGSSLYINHGRFRLSGAHYPPIILKAIALPGTITTGE